MQGSCYQIGQLQVSDLPISNMDDMMWKVFIVVEWLLRQEKYFLVIGNLAWELELRHLAGAIEFQSSCEAIPGGFGCFEQLQINERGL